MCQTESALVNTYRKTARPHTKDDGQGFEETEVNDTLNVFDYGEIRTPTLVIENHPADSRVKICEDGKKIIGDLRIIFRKLLSNLPCGKVALIKLNPVITED